MGSVDSQYTDSPTILVCLKVIYEDMSMRSSEVPMFMIASSKDMKDSKKQSHGRRK